MCISEMATDNAELPTRQTESEHDNNVVPANPVKEERRVSRELNEHRYRLKALTFTGEEKVEQFIQEFNDVMEVTKWPPRVALLKLKMSLMNKAKPYRLGLDINSIFASCGPVLAFTPLTPGPGYKDCGMIPTPRYKRMLPR